MSCQRIPMKDGTVVFALVRPGKKKVSAKDLKVLEEFAEELRTEGVRRQRERNRRQR